MALARRLVGLLLLLFFFYEGLYNIALSWRVCHGPGSALRLSPPVLSGHLSSLAYNQSKERWLVLRDILSW